MAARKKKRKNSNAEAAVLGAAFGALLGSLSGKKNDTITGALLGAAFGATANALIEAQENNMPVLVEERGALYYIFPDGRKKFVKKLKRKPKAIRNKKLIIE